MKSPFALLRKWWKIRTRREAVPPWHVTVQIVGSVAEDSGEIYGPTVRLSEGGFAFHIPEHCRILPSEGTVAVQVPDHSLIDVHTEAKYYE